MNFRSSREDRDDIPLSSPPPQYAASATSPTAYRFPSARSQQEQQYQVHILYKP